MRSLNGLCFPALLGMMLFALVLGLPRTAFAETGTYFLSCSTYHGGGVNWYFTDVFQAQLKLRGPAGVPGMGPLFVNGRFIDSSSVQQVLNDFQAYLTQKGYKFDPGSTSACDIKTTQAEAQTAKHKRAYEGNPCSNCGKVVETGWKEPSN